VPSKVKTSCCRTTPRCAGCPVLLASHARTQQRTGARAALVEEMLVGRPRPLPEPVQAALERLGTARALAR
jgi:hypothetical protein